VPRHSLHAPPVMLQCESDESRNKSFVASATFSSIDSRRVDMASVVLRPDATCIDLVSSSITQFPGLLVCSGCQRVVTDS
jgi:hypothetical protein